MLLTFLGTTLLNPNLNNRQTVPFVITYNPALPNISRIIHKHSNVLYSSFRCKNVFTNLPLVAYRRCKNISDILVRAKLPEPTNTDQSTMGDKSVKTLGSKIRFLSGFVTFSPLPPKAMLIFLFLRLHRPQRLHNIELGGRGDKRINARCK